LFERTQGKGWKQGEIARDGDVVNASLAQAGDDADQSACALNAASTMCTS